MKPRDIIDFYGTQQKAADALGCRQQSVQKWLKAGTIPPLRQFQIEALTGGKLKAHRQKKAVEVTAKAQ